ncbi:hypothetical protein CC1G_09529 [Coprinopsis cinerea okayama7|uniref:RxLR effector protein n=1 Tax=Coprinopsis cinerea (strain Okayama-7 / 130 / ATCC MYA-4618 / FGSC 9003) TaxID=240176 RepID=A8P0W0_COPC7|nr:hypothetical protein CC1G_09529 [Coprinopsis cinerea okayama7\|eukprot:XP_001837978.1 hypothetical protein CC1G_09529 [Coprinopsis cinerea okayama7\
MQLRFSFFALALLALNAVATPISYADSEDLEIRGKKPNPLPAVNQKVAKLPDDLRRKVFGHWKKQTLQRANARVGHKAIMQELKGQAPPGRWTDRTTAAWAVHQKNKNLRRELLDSDELEVRGRKPNPLPPVNQKVAKLPEELRRKVFGHWKKQTLQRANARAGHKAIVQELKGQAPPGRWTDRTTAAWAVHEKNKNLRRELELLDEVEELL